MKQFAIGIVSSIGSWGIIFALSNVAFTGILCEGSFIFKKNPEMSALFLVISLPIAIGGVAFLVNNLKWVARLNIVPYRVGRRCVSVVPYIVDTIGVRDTFDIVPSA